jgi:hypothetical protein
LAAAFLAAAVLVPTTSSSADRSFHDTVGEVDCCTRDLTNVVVRNDDAGRITFEIHFDGRPEGDDDDDLFVPLDTDRDTATGQSGVWGPGIDYMIGAHVWKGHADAIISPDGPATALPRTSLEGSVSLPVRARFGSRWTVT